MSDYSPYTTKTLFKNYEPSIFAISLSILISKNSIHFKNELQVEGKRFCYQNNTCLKTNKPLLKDGPHKL